MFRRSMTQTSFGLRRPWLANAGVTGIAILAIVAGVGYSQDTKSADSKKPDLPQRGAIGVFLYESEDHVLVSKVVPGSPAEKAGLQIGDDIRYVNNERTKTAHALMDEIASFKPGTQMDVVIRRGDKRQTVKINVAGHAELYPSASLKPATTTGAPAPRNPASVNPKAPKGPAELKTDPATLPGANAVTSEQDRRIRAMELQLARVQEQLARLKADSYVAKPAPPINSFDINSWLEQHRSGENEGDPALFQ